MDHPPSEQRLGAAAVNSRGVRTSQRRSLACQDCTKRKVKCDKKQPCSRCRRLDITCSREPVRLKRTLHHEDQIEFLQELLCDLEACPSNSSDVLHPILWKVRKRVQWLQFGDDAAERDNVDSSEKTDQDVISVARSRSNSNMNTATTEADPALLTTLEHLAWGRVSGNCFPHQSCRCEHRNAALSASNSAAPCGLPSLPAEDTARRLIQFHVQYLAWHHNCLHSPTFQRQCDHYWRTGESPGPQWIALYCSVLSATVFAIQNSQKSKAIVKIQERLPQAHELFSDMITALYRYHFLRDLSMHSLQAIVISTEVAHNLGQSQLNATLFNAAVRIAECLGLHRIEECSSDNWDAQVERETGKRIWCQMTIQDHFAIPFTESYTISPSHVSTSLPSNADDHDLIPLPESRPTVSSYTRVLFKMAVFMPEMRDGLGSDKDPKPLQEQYKHILSIDRRMRETVKTFPPYFLRQDSGQESLLPWLGVARRSLAITAAEKIIMIHRPFLFRSFQMPVYDFTRRTCIAAAITILREHEALVNADDLSIWTHTAFCITAAVILCFEVYHISDNTVAEGHKSAVRATRDRLVSRESDLLAQRGVALIEALLEQRPTNLGSSGNVVVDIDYIAAALYPVASSHIADEILTGTHVSSEAIPFPVPPIDQNYMEAGFDSWFNDMFMNDSNYMG